MNTSSDTRCIRCIHFRNSPEYLEGVYKGLTTFSSGYASVRRDDGICVLRDLYLSADASCGAFTREAPRIPTPFERVQN